MVRRIVAAALVALWAGQVPGGVSAQVAPPGTHECEVAETDVLGELVSPPVAYSDGRPSFASRSYCSDNAPRGSGAAAPFGTNVNAPNLRRPVGFGNELVYGVEAFVANVTAAGGYSDGYVTLDRCDRVSPTGPQTHSNLNHTVARPVANLTLTGAAPDGLGNPSVACIYNQAAVGTIVDMQGFFDTPGGFQSQSTIVSAAEPTRLVPANPPRRVFDSRTTGYALAAGSITRIETNAPTGARSVLVNLTMVGAYTSGYITADRCSSLTAGPQTRSTGNWDGPNAVANLAVVPVDPDGAFCVYNQAVTQLVADVQGHFVAATSNLGELLQLTPATRLLDTRNTASSLRGGTITRVETGAPAGTAAALVNLTMVNGGWAGYITADKCSALQPGAQTHSNGNHGTQTAVANLSLVPLDPDGSFCIFNMSPVALIVDLQGLFGSNGTLYFYSVSPFRAYDSRYCDTSQSDCLPRKP